MRPFRNPPDNVRHKTDTEKAGLLSVQLWDEGLALHKEVENNFPEMEKERKLLATMASVADLGFATFLIPEFGIRDL